MRPAVATCTNFHTSTVRQDIDQAAKYIGAGAATVGVAGSGKTVFSLGTQPQLQLEPILTENCLIKICVNRDNLLLYTNAQAVDILLL